MKKILNLTLRVIISAVILYLLIKKANASKIINTFSKTEAEYIIVSIILYILSQVVSAYRWSILLPMKIPYQRLLSYYFIGAFFNNFSPSIIGGDAVKSYYIYKYTGQGGVSLASIFMDRYLGFFALMVICLLAYIITIPLLGSTPIVWLVPSMILSFSVISILFWRLRWGEWFKQVQFIYKPVMDYKKDKMVLINGFLLSLLVQALGIISVYFLSIALKLDVSFGYFFLFLPVAISVAMLPISISGLGLREGAFVFLLGLIGIAPAHAISLSLLWFFTSSFANLIGGVEYIRSPLKRLKANE